MASGVVVGIQDMGAAGWPAASRDARPQRDRHAVELADVPQREAG
jgi:phosphoribosylformylglycinamidine (FGAM) synthase-like enzyme